MSTPAPDAVKRLIDRFDHDRKVFLSGDYKEEQLRAEFLNPFFTALGWDVDKSHETTLAWDSRGGLFSGATTDEAEDRNDAGIQSPVTPWGRQD
jgi:hypothetical protein